MRPPRPVPVHLRSRAFTRRQAIAAGITARMLQHPRFEQVHPSVYKLAGVMLDEAGRIEAARLALPEDALVSHDTRLRMIGLDQGDPELIHFTVARDLHLDIPGIMLHRTVVMPPNDGVGVSVEAALVGCAATMRLIDVVAVGDWLVHRGHTTTAALSELVQEQPWRPGAAEVARALPLMDGRSRSIPESQVRVCIVVAGLPRPEVNLDLHDAGGRFLCCGDLVYLLWKLLVEYEGGQHFADARQIESDVDRYARVRADGWAYVQVTKRHLGVPTNMVRRVHHQLVAHGYDGPPPVFGRTWDDLFRRPGPGGRRRAVDSQPHQGRSPQKR
jgi:hypothetical protein